MAFGGTESPARAYSAGMVAWDRHDYADAPRLWSRAVALQPDNPHFHYMLASALGRLGHRTSGWTPIGSRCCSTLRPGWRGSHRMD